MTDEHVHRTYVDGKVHVRRRMCSTCIFLPGNRMHLAPGRRDDMVADADAEGTAIPCHKHLYQDAPIEPVCRGYYDNGRSWRLQVAERIGILEWFDDPPDKT